MAKPKAPPMRIKERVIRDAMRRIERRVEVIKGIVDANPFSEIIALRKRASELIAKAGSNWESISAEVQQLADAEQKQLSVLKRQKKIGTLIEEEVRIEMEHAELRDELISMSWRGKLSDQEIPPPIGRE